MRLITHAFDRNEAVDYAEIALTKELASTILTARKKILELRVQHPELSTLAELTFDANGIVQYFDGAMLGKAGLRIDPSPKSRVDLLTEEQRKELDEEEFVEISSDLKLHTNTFGESYDSMSLDQLVVSEEWWKFLSYTDNGIVESLALNFDILKKVL